MPNFPTRSVPGTYVVEGTAGALPATLATHETFYMVISSSQPGAPVGVPHYVVSTEDFVNVFGASPSQNAAKLFFAQRSGTGFYAINVPKRDSRTVALATVTTNTTYSLTVGTATVSYVATASDDAEDILTRLADAVNSELGILAGMTKVGANWVIRYKTGLTVTASPAAITLGTATVAGTYPTINDVADCLRTYMVSELPQGFIAAPEFFQRLTSTVNHNALANTLEAHAADSRFKWVALIDCSAQVGTTAASAGTMINAAKAERSGLSSPIGHSWYYVPYLVDLADNQVPPSPAIAGLTIRRYREESFVEPPAGTKYPLYGMKSLTFSIDDLVQSQLNPLGINCIRNLPNRGTVCWGARTLSTDPLYRFGNTRVIMNVFIGSARGAFDSFIFSAVTSSLGGVMGRIKGTLAGVADRIYRSGGLFGRTAEEAYLVICDDSNNPPASLENGIVYATAYLKPSPTLEVLVVQAVRTALGTEWEEVVQTELSDGATS